MRSCPTQAAQAAHTVRFVSSPRTAGFFTGWDRIASEVMGDPRSEAAPDQHDRGLSGPADLVRQLPAHSEALRAGGPRAD